MKDHKNPDLDFMAFIFFDSFLKNLIVVRIQFRDFSSSQVDDPFTDIRDIITDTF